MFFKDKKKYYTYNNIINSSLVIRGCDRFITWCQQKKHILISTIEVVEEEWYGILYNIRESFTRKRFRKYYIII